MKTVSHYSDKFLVLCYCNDTLLKGRSAIYATFDVWNKSKTEKHKRKVFNFFLTDSWRVDVISLAKQILHQVLWRSACRAPIL